MMRCVSVCVCVAEQFAIHLFMPYLYVFVCTEVDRRDSHSLSPITHSSRGIKIKKAHTMSVALEYVVCVSVTQIISGCACLYIDRPG